MCRSQTLVITGVGKSGIVARKIAATFSSIGLMALFLNPPMPCMAIWGLWHRKTSACCCPTAVKQPSCWRCCPT